HNLIDANRLSHELEDKNAKAEKLDVLLLNSGCIDEEQLSTRYADLLKCGRWTQPRQLEQADIKAVEAVNTAFLLSAQLFPL
ncbi:hypothetical protein CWB60_20465, partial [Pseudoalteromonas sp. S327]|uniref:hypothetical protein n=1 Tax=Pseudoalteromonas sp. S327 TaxID=579535 RepID=UPI0012737AD7